MKKIFQISFRNSRGQSVIIEYASIAILIILGILVIGPYVVRSVNAYFKTAEEQAHDSFREEIRQAQLQGRETTYRLDEGCECNELPPVCGDGTSCAFTDLMFPKQCVPATCAAYAVGTERCGIESAPVTAWDNCNSTYSLGSPLGFPICNQIQPGMYPCEEYAKWAEQYSCGYKCCTAAELAEAKCYYLTAAGIMIIDGGEVKYKGNPHNGNKGWQLSVGDRVIDDGDNKIYTVVEPQLPDGAVAHWALDGDGGDSVGTHDWINNGVSFLDGQVGQAGYFTGSGYFQVDSLVPGDGPGDPAIDDLALTDFSLEAWVRNAGVSPNTYQTILSKGEGAINGNSNYQLSLINFSNNPTFPTLNNLKMTRLVCSFEDKDDYNYYAVSNTAVPVNTFFHAVCTFDKGDPDDSAKVPKMKLYINGSEISSSLLTTSLAGFPQGLEPSLEAADLYIGGTFSSTADGSGTNTVVNFFSGLIDEVVIYYRELSDGDVEKRYKAGLGSTGWDGDEAEWDGGEIPRDNLVVRVSTMNQDFIFSGGKWSLYTDAGASGDGYVKKKKKCGPSANVVQYFFEKSPACGNRCAEKDPRATWCSEAANFNIPVELDGTVEHVTGETSCASAASQACLAWCPLAYPASDDGTACTDPCNNGALDDGEECDPLSTPSNPGGLPYPDYDDTDRNTFAVKTYAICRNHCKEIGRRIYIQKWNAWSIDNVHFTVNYVPIMTGYGYNSPIYIKCNKPMKVATPSSETYCKRHKGSPGVSITYCKDVGDCDETGDWLRMSCPGVKAREDGPSYLSQFAFTCK
jgi:hypothetical protein